MGVCTDLSQQPHLQGPVLIVPPAGDSFIITGALNNSVITTGALNNRCINTGAPTNNNRCINRGALRYLMKGLREREV